MSAQDETSVRQEAGSVEGSDALRMPEEKAEEIINALQTDLAATYVLYHQLKKHHWVVEGAEFNDLHLFLGDAAADAEEAADELAERIQALGGVPVSGGAALEEHAPIEPEGEDVYDIRTSLENDIHLYGEIIESLREHISVAGNLGDYNTRHMLEEILEDAEEYAHHIEHYLEDDTLVTEEAMR
ncbi:DNA starvation/stationary phase protection protein [Salinarchaeum sp. IM2453]|uniref:DNA starvation/stationary phase protection protein DpsA n=1 Tax=Salinarchaeum sp. IM2453 TaxID=2862870 RepID=UPI001C833694|nr:DNA starvation/stationary phase protection protein DpsA [Salinarchaeum sp. IM2453]QZA88598.1 DNA starvation/stationary phase protection protein [Salinarchaeum sp. IM2453]